MIISNDKEAVVYNGEYKPVNVFSGRKKVAGWKEEEYTGKHIEVEDTYNDVLDVAVQGHHEQDSRSAVWWNQIIRGKTGFVTNVSVTITDNIYILTATNTENSQVRWIGVDGYKNNIIASHKYIIRTHIYENTFVNSPLSKIRNIICWNGTKSKSAASVYSTTTINNTIYSILSIASDVELTDRINFYFDLGSGGSFEHTQGEYVKFSYNITNLTAMFGEGKEPTIEQFRKMYPCDYYPYCAGEWRYANKGQWVNFNQLAKNVSSDFNNTYKYEGSKQIFYDDDGLHLVSTVNTINPTYVALKNSFNKTHKYLLSVNAKYIPKGNGVAYIGFVAPNHGLVARTYITPNVDFNTYYIICDDMSNVSYITIGRFGQGSYNIEGNEIVIKNPQLIDLTQMFGEGNEPTTVEEFKALYPNEYYEYVESRYEDTGGYYEDGQVVEHIPDTAFVTPFPEMPEEIRCVENHKIEVGSTKAPERFVPTTTEIPFKLYGANGINDTCEPCVLVDGEWKCRVTRRWGSVDLGSLSWIRSTLGDIPCFRNLSVPNKNNKESIYAVCSYYINNPYVNSDKTFAATRGDSRALYVRDDTYTDIAQFQQSVQGAMMFYRLATPTIELYDPIPVRTLPINSIIDCDAEMEANVKVVDRVM